MLRLSNYRYDVTHVGITADIVGRYHKNYGRDTFFMTGTDEHGKKIADSAEKKGIKPIEICNLYANKFQDLNKKLSVVRPMTHR